jgi:threonine aldolase
MVCHLFGLRNYTNLDGMNRRHFLRAGSLTALPVLAPAIPVLAGAKAPQPVADKTINFLQDGIFLSPEEYVSKLSEIIAAKKISRDFYGEGGVVEELEKKFVDITGKEKAIYMPSGTMANELALHVLSGDNTKVFVQELSHIYRDEADAAQSVFNKRLIPLAKGEYSFTLEELKSVIDYHNTGEVFKSGIGAISIEVPVRRADNRTISIEEIRRISRFCKENNYKLHLDGARIYMAAAFTGVSVKEYSSYFDTVYISLYKYLGAAGGAILCGNAAIIDKMRHLVKVHGGAVFGNWPNAAMANHFLDGFDKRLRDAAAQAGELFTLLNQVGIKVTPYAGGTNVFTIQLPAGVSDTKLQAALSKEHAIAIGRKSADGIMRIKINETLLYRDNNKILQSFKDAMKTASV